MVLHGRVQNGVVVLTEGAHLQEGQEVNVLATPASASPAHSLLDIPPVSLGAEVVPASAADDLLGEMLVGRS
jgi:hypothetical protein